MPETKPQTKQIKNIEERKVTWSDGKFNYCSDDKVLSILQYALSSNQSVSVVFETNKKGYWDVKTAELIKGESKGESKSDSGAIAGGGLDSERWRSMAVAYAKDLANAQVIPFDELLDTAEMIYSYIINGTNASNNPLVEEAKRLGAKQ